MHHSLFLADAVAGERVFHGKERGKKEKDRTPPPRNDWPEDMTFGVYLPVVVLGHEEEVLNCDNKEDQESYLLYVIDFFSSSLIHYPSISLHD